MTPSRSSRSTDSASSNREPVDYRNHPEALRAKTFACQHHDAIDQRRKYTNEPYTTHLEAVVDLVASVRGHTIQQLQLAWLHDILDTKATLQQVAQQFGPEVASGVRYLSPVAAAYNLPRQRRLALFREQVRHAPDWVKTVKVADVLHNSRTIAHRDPAFAVIYLSEKSRELSALIGAERELWDRAAQTIIDAVELNG